MRIHFDRRGGLSGIGMAVTQAPGDLRSED